MDEWRALCQKELSFARLKRDCEFFTPEGEADFNRRVAESEQEVKNRPSAMPENLHPEFDEVLATYPSGMGRQLS
jgi:hypothetical protein